ncbi:MAG: glycosyltransferase 2 family protein [Thermomicrobiales bacterium]|nr:glycosyltransferase 2 family protein [Thermomicrobiales bacterium]
MKSWRVALGLLISAGFLAYAFRGQDYSRIREAVGQANYVFMIPALCCYLVGVSIRAFRWKILLRSLVDVPTRQIVPINAVGFMANNVLPLRTGELVRAYVVSQRFGVRKTAALATIAVERLFDGLTMLGFILTAATVVSLTSQLRHIALLAFLLFAGALIGLFVLTLGGNLRDRLLQIVLGPLPATFADRVERMAESMLSGLGVLRRKTDLSLVAGASIVAWLLEASTYWWVSRAFGHNLTDVMGVPETLLTTGIANLATLIPSGPGYVGTFENGIGLVLSNALGITKTLALSYAIVLHALLFFPVTIWGAFEWWRQHLSLRSVRELESEANGTAAPATPIVEVPPRGLPRREAPR